MGHELRTPLNAIIGYEDDSTVRDLLACTVSPVAPIPAGFDGYKTCRRLRAHPGLHGTKTCGI